MHNWQHYPSSNWYEIDPKTRFYIWRSVVAPSDATEKTRNICAQLQSILYTSAQKRFWKIYFLSDFRCAKTCSYRTVFGLPVWNLTIAVCAIWWHAEKKLCKWATFSALNYCSVIIFFKSLSYLYEVVRTNFSADFWTVGNFRTQFRENCGAT